MAYSQVAVDQAKLEIFGNPFSVSNQNFMRILDGDPSNAADNMLFEFDDWSSAEVVPREGGSLTVDSVNYHRKLGSMFFLKEEKLYFLYPDKIESIVIQGRTFIPAKLDPDKPRDYKYCELLSGGRLNLLKHTDIKERKKSDHPMGISHTSGSIETYTKDHYYFARASVERAMLLPKNKKKLIGIFTKDRNRMVQYARDNNISMKSETDLINMFDYYNQID